MQALGLIETKGLLAAVEAADVMVKSADVSIIEKTYVGGGLVTISVTGDVGAVKASVESAVAAVKKLDDKLLVSNHVIPRPHEELESIIGPNNPDPLSNENIETVEDIEIAEFVQATQTLENTKTIKDTNGESVQTVENLKDTESIEVLKDTEDSKAVGDTESVKILKDIVDEDNAEYTKKADTVEKVEDIKTVENTEHLDVDTKNNIKEDQNGLDVDLDEVHKLNLEKLHKDDVDNLVRKNGIEKAVLILAKLKVVKLRNLAREYKDFVITGRAISKAGKNSLITKFKLYYEKN
ncbi:BMC domain-containing protein [Clostridium botulinum]|nr:BMC domain-containing protein [Clostridium botulinum]